MIHTPTGRLANFEGPKSLLRVSTLNCRCLQTAAPGFSKFGASRYLLIREWFAFEMRTPMTGMFRVGSCWDRRAYLVVFVGSGMILLRVIEFRVTRVGPCRLPPLGPIRMTRNRMIRARTWHEPTRTAIQSRLSQHEPTRPDMEELGAACGLSWR